MIIGWVFVLKNRVLKAVLKASILGFAALLFLPNVLWAGVLSTNESFIKKVQTRTNQSVLDYVFKSLNDKITVYPGEGYYYFNFLYNGDFYKGNIRFAKGDRDKGILYYALFKPSGSLQDADNDELIGQLDKSHVFFKLEKRNRLNYKITYKKRTIAVHINDLLPLIKTVKVPSKHHYYVGPIYDESAIVFDLFFNENLKRFVYYHRGDIGSRESYVQLDANILIGKRTGFAYLRFGAEKQKIFIGGSRLNMTLNNYYDGPFDQLPDDTLDGDKLTKLIEIYDPREKGKLSSGGMYKGQEADLRYAIAPYVDYVSIKELKKFDICASRSSVDSVEMCVAKMMNFKK